MTRWLGFALVAVLVAAATHIAIVLAAPHAIMNAAMARVGGGEANAWRHAPRTTAASRAVVRPSPDLAYSACVYDLSDGPVVVTMSPGADYWSLSLFAASSDNFFTRNDRAAPNGVEIMLLAPGMAEPDGAAEIVRSPSVRGIALQRRLAPSAEAFAAADAARSGDICADASVTQ